mgnify:CR=1 FL=1
MTNYSNRLAIVIPTKDRPDDLRKLLASLERQSRAPDQVIIINLSGRGDKDVAQMMEILSA